MQSIAKGSASSQGEPRGGFSLDLKYTREEGTIYITGIQSLVRLAIDQHRADRRRGLKTATFVSGYPGSPLAGLDLELYRQKQILAEHDVSFVPGLNEELAATAVFGSQMMHSLPGAKFDGVLGMWFGKNPGTDRSGDAFRHANIRGVGKNGGVLALTGDDPKPRSSTLSTDANLTFYDFFMPIIYPGDVQDVLDLGLHGFMLSRTSGLWVGMKVVSEVADSAGTAEVSPDRIVPVIPSVDLDGRAFRPELQLNTFIPEILEVERGLYAARLELAKLYARENDINHIAVPTKEAWLGILTAGKTYFDVRQALRELGLDDEALRHYGIRILKMGLLFPVEPEIIREFTAGLEEVLVIEEKRPFLEAFLKEMLYASPERPMVVGKVDEEGRELLPMHGGLDVDRVARAIARRLGRRVSVPSVESRIRELDASKPATIPLSITRGAYYCSGCPHNRSLVVPDESAPVGAGIGCHFMALFGHRREFGQVLGYTQMGGEGAQWIGLAPFTETPHFVQNLGDGTFFHSGSLAVRFAVANDLNVTFKLLYNSAVAMTGGQPVPGGRSIPELTRLLAAEGVRRIIVTTDDLSRYRGAHLSKGTEVWHRDRMLEAERGLAATSGVTVLIHDQQCAAEKRRLRRRGKLEDPATRVFINERVCEGCGDCGEKSNCLSVQPVQTEFGHKTQIHQSSCNKDYSCLLGDCPSFVSVTARQEAHQDGHPTVDIDLLEPELKVDADDFSVLMMGIGGTGVVTVNQILGTAALLDGKKVRALDDLGFSQKAGPVVSHMKVFSTGRPTSNNVATGGADLYLAFDLLTSIRPDNLARAGKGRTVAVASTSEVPTGQMIVDSSAEFPELAQLLSAVNGVTRSHDNVYLDAQRLSESLFGDHMPANILLLGAAYQAGALPVSAQAIEEAIRLNRVAVEMNLEAFRWGRAAVVDPERVQRVADGVRQEEEPPQSISAAAQGLLDVVGATGELRRLLEIRIPDLIDYQNVAYATRYVEFVKRVKEVEEEKAGGETRIAEAVARNLYKLMAYKDEYEVARLHLRPEFRQGLKARFGEDARITWHLHPPLLRALGLKKKIRLGNWFGPAFRLLRAVRRLRGTPLDPFGVAKVRKVERRLISEYQELVETALSSLTDDNSETVLSIANLPDEIRGYEDIKLRSVERYRQKAEEYLSELSVEAERVPTSTRS